MVLPSTSPSPTPWPHRGEGHVDDVEATLQPWGDNSSSTPWRAHGSHQEHVLESKDKEGRETGGMVRDRAGNDASASLLVIARPEDSECFQ